MCSHFLPSEDTELDIDKILANFPHSPSEVTAPIFPESTTLEIYRKLCATLLNENVDSPFIDTPDPKVLDHNYLSTLAKHIIGEPTIRKKVDPFISPTPPESLPQSFFFMIPTHKHAPSKLYKRMPPILKRSKNKKSTAKKKLKIS